MSKTETQMVYLPSQSMSASDYEAAGNEWSPQLHFTGAVQSDGEIDHINGLIRKYGDSIVAHYVYAPMPGMYSVELQFSDRDNMLACKKEYESSFTEGGKLRKAKKPR